MIDDKLRATISGLIGVERRRRITATQVAIRGVREEFTKADALGHGRLSVSVEEVSAREYEDR